MSKNDDFCIKNEELCSKNDEFCSLFTKSTLVDELAMEGERTADESRENISNPHHILISRDISQRLPVFLDHSKLPMLTNYLVCLCETELAGGGVASVGGAIFLLKRLIFLNKRLIFLLKRLISH